MTDNQIVCEECFRIRCKKCLWVAAEEEVVAIQEGRLTSCPLCGWKPGDKID